MRITSDFDRDSTAAEVVADLDLTGRRYLVTGGYSGIGLETSRALAGAGATVVVAGRDLHRAGETALELRGLGADRSAPLELDLARGDDIDEAVEHLGAVGFDGIICNAGVMACPLRRTDEGWEWHMAVNVLGHLRLVVRLLPTLHRVDHAPRVVFLSSSAHHLAPFSPSDPHWYDRDYDKWQAYGQSKTADSLAAVALQATGLVPGLDAFAVHPGGILTPLQRHLTQAEMVGFGWIDEDGKLANEHLKTPEQGAATTVWAATAPTLRGAGGRYLEDCAEAVPANDERRGVGVRDHAIDPVAAETMWAWALRSLELDPTDPTQP